MSKAKPSPDELEQAKATAREIARRKQVFWDNNNKCYIQINSKGCKRLSQEEIEEYWGTVELDLALLELSKVPGNRLEEHNGWWIFHLQNNYLGEPSKKGPCVVARVIPWVDNYAKGITPSEQPPLPNSRN